MGRHALHVFHKSKRGLLAAFTKRAEAVSCPNGFYQAPTMGEKIDSLKPLTISWDPACLSGAQEIDIHLIAGALPVPNLHTFEKVAVARKTIDVELMPRWWNSTSSVDIQVQMSVSNEPIWMFPFNAGPVITATYAEPADGVPKSADTTVIDAPTTKVNDLQAGQDKMDPGKTAAAVLIPLLFIGLCIGAYIKWKRSKTLEKSRAWTEKVDRRMSTISTDWKSVSAAGANAAIRNSIAVGGRNSAFAFGNIRPQSSYIDGDEEYNEKPGIRTGTGVGLRNPASLSNSTERVSRVSFAPDTRVSRVSFADSRPSGESRRTRAFHEGYVPPVPALPESANEKASSSESEESQRFSPRQTQGALTLTPEDIRSRITNGGSAKDSVYDEVMPALSMMRTGGTDPSHPDDYLFSAPPATPPTPALPAASYPKPSAMSSPVGSPVLGSMAQLQSMQPMPASVMSPDEMLRAYAERKKSLALSGAGGAGASQIAYPQPAASASTPIPTVSSIANTGMKILYTKNEGNNAPAHISRPSQPTSPISPTNTGFGAQGMSLNGYAASEYSTYTTSSSDAVHPTTKKNNPFGHHANASIGVGKYGGAKYAIGDDEEDAYAAYGAGVEQGQVQGQGQYDQQAYAAQYATQGYAQQGQYAQEVQEEDVGMAGRGAYGYTQGQMQQGGVSQQGYGYAS